MKKFYNKYRTLFYKLNFWGQRRRTLEKFETALIIQNIKTTHVISGCGFLFTFLSIPLVYISFHDKALCIKLLISIIFYLFPLIYSLHKKASPSKLRHNILVSFTILLVLSQTLIIALYNIQTTGITIFCVVLVMMNMLIIQPLFSQVIMDTITMIVAIFAIVHIPEYTNTLPSIITLIISVSTGLIGGILLQRMQVTNVITNERTQHNNKTIKQRSIQTYKQINQEIVYTFSNFIDSKDSYTNGHSLRVAEYSYLLGQKMNYSNFDLEVLYYSALLHDVGKIAIPDTILNKQEPLTTEEFEIIKQHPINGKKMLSTFTSIPDLTIGVEFHHERIDGKGYPYGLKGSEIPLNAQIIAVADTWDALTTKRVYRTNFTREQAIKIMQDIAGTQLSKSLVSIFLQNKIVYAPILSPESMREKRIKAMSSFFN